MGAAVLMAASGSPLAAQYPAQVKVLSYNLWGRQNALIQGGYDSLALVISEIDPDVSGHQEVDRVNRRSKRVDVIQYLEDLTGMHSLYAPALKDHQDGEYAEGLLADSVPLSHRLFWVEGRWRLLESAKPTHYTASDHDPVWAILELLNPRGSG